MAVLLSPVAWIHHLHWMVVVIFAVLGADPLRDRRRLVGRRASSPAFFLCRMPWWGITWLSHPDWPRAARPGAAERRHLRLAARPGAAGWSLSRTIPLRAHPVTTRTTRTARTPTGAHRRARLSRQHQPCPAQPPKTPTICSALTAASRRQTLPPIAPDRGQPHPGQQGPAEEGREAGDGGQRGERADEHRERVVVLLTREAVSSCDRSPHSARNSTEKHVATALSPAAVAAPLVRELLLGLGLLLVGLAAPRSSRMPPTRNITAAKISTGVLRQLGEQPAHGHGDERSARGTPARPRSTPAAAGSGWRAPGWR